MNKLLLPLKLAWRSIFANKGRTVLTLFGIVIGIAAVIIVMSAGESLKGMVLGQVESFGNNIIQAETKVPSSAGATGSAMSTAAGVQITSLKISDAEDVAKLPNIKGYYAMVMGQSVISYLDQNKAVNYLGVSPGFVDIDNGEIDQGRFFTEDEDRELAKVIVLGYKVSDKLFGNENAIGQSVKVGKNKFLVIGVYKERGGSLGVSFDDMAYIPIQTAQKQILGIDHIMTFIVQMNDSDIQDQTAEEIKNILRENHNIDDPKDDDFAVTTMEEMKKMIDTIFGGITLLLVALAAISLLVGGIGIMNIMYVSVTERTFEIGLKKSIGARKKQILWQFLWEAIVVTIFGGLIGIGLGASMSYLITLIANYLGFDWLFVLPPSAIIISFVFCAAVGIIFGYYPAKKAASLDPITALRKE